MHRGRILAPTAVAVLASGLLTAAPAVAAEPTITGFSPSSGILRSAVTITGRNFTAPASVSFAGVPATSTLLSATRISARVPDTAPSGPITVSSGGGSSTSADPFTVRPGAVLSARVGPPGVQRTVYASGFTGGEPLDVSFDGTRLARTFASRTGAAAIPITTPATATPGAHTVAVLGRRSRASTSLGYTVRTDWTQTGFNAGHTGVNPQENGLTAGNVGGLTARWRSPVGDTPLSPIAVGGVVYDVSSSPARLQAVDERTGASKWTYTVPESGVSADGAPAVAGRTVLFTAGSSLYVIDAATGTLAWQYTAPAVIHSTPVVSDGVVFFGVAADLTVIDLATHKVWWSHNTRVIPVGAVPAVAGGNVFVANTLGVVHAHEIRYGPEAWTYDTGSPFRGVSVTAVGGRVFVGNEAGNFYALRASDGSLLWTHAGAAPVRSSAVVSGRTVYYGAADGSITALDTVTGRQQWSTTPDSSPQRAFAVANGLLYTGGDADLHVLDAASGAPVTTLSGANPGAAIVVNGAVLVAERTGDGSVVRYTPAR